MNFVQFAAHLRKERNKVNNTDPCFFITGGKCLYTIEMMGHINRIPMEPSNDRIN